MAHRKTANRLGAIAAALALALAALALPAASAAERAGDSLAYDPPGMPEAPDTAAMLLRLALGTACVLGLSASTLWLGKRWLRGAPAGGAARGQIRLVESIALGNRCSVFLLEVKERQILAGIDGSGLKTLLALPEPFERALERVESTEAPELAGAPF
jgi:flagellar biogenesis protein FliO